MANPFVRVGGFFGRFFGNTIGEAAAYGIGGALREPLHPLLQELTNKTWQAGTLAGVSKPLDPTTAAEVAAEKFASYDEMATEASFSGYDKDRFAHLWDVTLTAPGMGELLSMLRRTSISPDDFSFGLRKAKIGERWDTALTDLQHARIPVDALAYMVVRGLVDDAGLLPVAPPASGVKIKRYPVAALDTLKEAGAWGWSEDRFRALVGRSGLSMAPVMAANALFRGIIEQDDYYLAIAEGDLRNEWRDAIRDASRQILTSGEYVERQIRGFTDRTGRLKDTDKHGMSHEDSDKLYEVLGRSPSIHTLVVGLARGGKYPGSYANIPEPYRSDIQRSNIREEFSEVAYAARYNYPSAFVLRALAEAGDLGNTAAVEQILLEIGWKPALAAQVAGKWAPKGAATDPYVKKAQTQLWTTTHTSYKAQEIDDAQATGSFDLLGIPASAQTEIFTLWRYERGLRRAQLSPADVRKAWQQGDINDATKAAWTQDEARAALIDRGWSVEQANDYLNIPYKG